MNTNESCVIDYIQKQDIEVQHLLHEVRDAIRSVIPEAQERISWRMPTYWDQKNIIHFAAFKKHIGLYPGPDAIVHFSEALADYKTSKGAIQLPYDKPLPIQLIVDITKWCTEARKKSE